MKKFATKQLLDTYNDSWAEDEDEERVQRGVDQGTQHGRPHGAAGVTQCAHRGSRVNVPIPATARALLNRGDERLRPAGGGAGREQPMSRTATTNLARMMIPPRG